MIHNDFDEYSHFNNKEEFQKYAKEHCEWCWANTACNCDNCKQNKVIIEKAFDKKVGEG